MLFDAIFLTAFFLTWALLGALVWLAWSIRRRAVGAFWALPFALAGGMAAGVLVPALGLDDGLGIGISMIAAPIGAALLTAAAYRVWDDYDFATRLRRLAPPDFPNDATPPATPPPTPSSSVAGDQPTPSIDSMPPETHEPPDSQES